MTKPKKSEIRVLPVAWSAGRVTKVQASGQFGSVRIFGNPCTNRGLALRSLNAQCLAFLKCAVRTIDTIKPEPTRSSKSP